MDASIVDLRYHMADVLKAIKRRETVNVFQRNKLIGYLIPLEAKPLMRVQDHPFFGSAKDDPRPVREIIRTLRAPRKFNIPDRPAPTKTGKSKKKK